MALTGTGSPAGGEGRHWAYAWLGRPYAAGTSDCATLVEDVLRARGVELRLPSRAAGQRGRDVQLAATAEQLAVPVEGQPREGDVVLMQAAGRRDDVGRHVGVWCEIAGVPHVLHCIADVGTCLHSLDARALAGRGFRVVGVYRARAPDGAPCGQPG